MSKIQVNDIVNHYDDGAPNFPKGIVVGSGATLGFNVGTGASIYSPSDNVLTLGTNNAERLRITSDGDVNIGPSANANGHGLLTLSQSAAAAFNALVIQQGNTAFTATDGLQIGIDAGVHAYIKQYENRDIYFTTGNPNTEKLRITSGGKLGIGTDNPITTVHIQSTTTAGDLEIDRIGNNANGPELILRHVSSSPANNDYIGQITFSGRDDADNNTTVARIDGVMSNVVNGSESGEIIFNTRHNGVFSEKARFNSTGNLAFASGNGVDFSATADGSGTVGTNGEILDDYEEGTWTPTYQGSVSNPTVTYSSRGGTYVKIGKLVTISCYMNINAKSGGGGNLLVGGLPFTLNNAAGSGGSPSMNNVNLPDGTANIATEGRQNTTQFYAGLSSRDNATWANLQTSQLPSGSSNYRVEMNYYTDS